MTLISVSVGVDSKAMGGGGHNECTRIYELVLYTALSGGKNIEKEATWQEQTVL